MPGRESNLELVWDPDGDHDAIRTRIIPSIPPTCYSPPLEAMGHKSLWHSRQFRYLQQLSKPIPSRIRATQNTCSIVISDPATYPRQGDARITRCSTIMWALILGKQLRFANLEILFNPWQDVGLSTKGGKSNRIKDGGTFQCHGFASLEGDPVLRFATVLMFFSNDNCTAAAPMYAWGL